MKYRELLDLIEEGENIQCEFKREFSTPEKIARGLMAFANTKGGFMLFGVDDDKKLSVLKAKRKLLNWLLILQKIFVNLPLML